MREFEKNISDQKPEAIEYSTKCLGCPKVQEKIEEINVLRILQKVDIELASAIMDDAEREMKAREKATQYAQVLGISIEKIEELTESLKQSYPMMIEANLSCNDAQEQAIRDEITSKTERCKDGPHTLIAFGPDGNLSSSGAICGLEVPKKGEKLVTAIIYREVQIDKN